MTTGKSSCDGQKDTGEFSERTAAQKQSQHCPDENQGIIRVKGAIIVHSVEEVLEELKKYDSEDVYVIGGEQIYRQMLPYCDTAHKTKIDHA